MKQGWKSYRFDDVFDLQMGKTPSRNDSSYWGGTNAWVSIADMNEQKFISSTKESITDKGVTGSGIKVVPKDTVIMSFKLSIGKTCIAATQLYTNEAIMAFITKKEHSISSEFIYYYLRGYKWEGANKAVMGMTLNKKTISESIFSYPPLPEQEKIVSELDCLSRLIEKKRQQLKELDALAQSIFYEMFGNPVENERGWEVKKLGEISVIGTGATPSRGSEGLYYDGDIPWVKTTEIQNCEITNTEESITQQAIEDTNCKVYPSGTLLMAMYGQGKTRGQIAKLRIDAATNQACAAIMLNKEMSDMDFIYELLLINYENIRAMAQGGNQANLNLKLVSSIPIILPPFALQKEFALKVEAIEKQKELIKQSITEAETLLASRMQYYFE